MNDIRFLGTLLLLLAACDSPAGGDASLDASLGDSGTDGSLDTGFDARTLDAHVSADASVDADVDASGPPLGRSCSVDEDCDDENPRTTDSCLRLGAPTGVCVYRDCFTDDECDDGDVLTVGACAVGEDGVSYLCEQTLRPFRCRVASDCETLLSCESATCEAGFCRFDWTDDCGVEEDPLPPCTTEEREGAICCDGPTCLPVCRLSGSADCPVVLACAFRGDASRYVRIQAAGASCPSEDCPSEPSDPGAECAADQVACDYGPSRRVPIGGAPSPDHDYGGGPYCRCVDGGWACVGSWCPLYPPEHGAVAEPPSWASTPSERCDYRGLTCMVVREDDDAYRWRCELGLGACTREPPLSEGECVPGFDGVVCSYSRDRGEPADAYDGECRCTEEGWRCTESRSSSCPDEEPEESDPCTRDPGNQICRYFSEDSARSCRCDLSEWYCDVLPI